jgi:mRNA interferase RelE/StbE
MTWKVRLTERAHKDLGKLEPQGARGILAFFHDRIEGDGDPRSLGAALRGSELGEFWNYRIGDWRAICSIEDESVIVFVLTVQHRSKA